MKMLIILLIMILSGVVNTSWPMSCEGALVSLLYNLEKKSVLDSPSPVYLGENYIEGGRPRSCLVETTMSYNWFIGMHLNGPK